MRRVEIKTNKGGSFGAQPCHSALLLHLFGGAVSDGKKHHNLPLVSKRTPLNHRERERKGRQQSIWRNCTYIKKKKLKRERRGIQLKAANYVGLDGKTQEEAFCWRISTSVRTHIAATIGAFIREETQSSGRENTEALVHVKKTTTTT